MLSFHVKKFQLYFLLAYPEIIFYSEAKNYSFIRAELPQKEFVRLLEVAVENCPWSVPHCC